MAEGGEHLVSRTQILVDRLGLGRRFHHYNIHDDSLKKESDASRMKPARHHRTDIGPPTWTGKSLRSSGLLQFYLLQRDATKGRLSLQNIIAVF
jgi:hypothetical protein